MKLRNLLVVISASILFLFCKKDEPQPQSPAPTPVFVRMTDAPAAYQAVYIDLQGVEITGQGKAVALNVNPGIYNLLDFSNGVDTLIATGSITGGKVQQVRLILGTANSVVADSVTYPLSIPSGAESGLKINVHHDLQAGVAYELLLDFDAHQSIVLSGNGSYHLKPVIRAVENALSGAISGMLSQPGVSAVVTASGGASSYSSIPDSTGAFIIQGVPAGTYTVSAVPAAPYSSVTISNVSVITGSITSVGTMTI